jgi:plasmid maintenance system antidote protein VapI
MTTPAPLDPADALSETLLAPLRSVGEMLAREIDASNARIARLEAELRATREAITSLRRTLDARTEKDA